MIKNILKFLLIAGGHILIVFTPITKTIQLIGSRRKKPAPISASSPVHIDKNRADSIRRIHRLLIALGIILLFAASGIWAYSELEDYIAGQRAKEVLLETRAIKQFPVIAPDNTPQIPEIESVSVSPQLSGASVCLETPVITGTISGEPEPESHSNPEPSAKPTPTKSTYETIGILSIPRFGLELPVLSECNDKLLKVSICRYLGTANGEPKRLVIAGHNYKSHFGKIPQLEQGDEVIFTGFDGITRRYNVNGLMEIDMDDQKALVSGEWDITLFTCTPDGVRRILVRCGAAD